MTAGAVRRLGVIVVAIGLAATPIPRAMADPVLAAAGDIACAPGTASTAGTCQQQATANLVDSNTPTAVAALGDNQYNSGTYAEYTGAGAFGATWGAFKSLIHPALGNHEYGSTGTSQPSGYFDYFNGVGVDSGPAGNRGDGWYSYDLGVWHVIVLNSSNDCAPVSCAAGQPEETWLKDDLAAHPGQCTLAYWHHPRFTSGPVGDDTLVEPFWDDLYAAHAAIVLNGHDHDYERFGPQDPTGVATVDGVREFVVGTGGKDHFPIGTPDANSEFRDDQHFGALFLTLHQGSYDWAFKGLDGTVLDSGPGSCRYQPPTAASGAAGSVSDTGAGVSGSVNPQGDPATYRFEWGTSTGYGSSTPEQPAGSDSTAHSVSATLSGLSPSTTYHFRVVAGSPAGTSYGDDHTFATSPPPTSTPPTSTPPTSTPPDSPPPSVQPPSSRPSTLTAPGLVGTASLLRVERLVAVLRHGLRLRLSCSVTCTMRVTLSLAGLSARSAAAGKMTLRMVAGSRRLVRIRLSSRARRLLVRRNGGHIVVRLNAAAGSRRWGSTRSVLVR